jgi:hypothetical protein
VASILAAAGEDEWVARSLAGASGLEFRVWNIVPRLRVGLVCFALRLVDIGFLIGCLTSEEIEITTLVGLLDMPFI